MSSSSSEIEENQNNPNLRNVRQALFVFVLQKDPNQVEKRLKEYDLNLLADAGKELYRSWFPNAQWDLRERVWAVIALDRFNNLNNDFYPHTAAAIQGITEAQQQLKAETLNDDVFGDEDEYDNLTRNLWFAFAGMGGTTAESRLTHDIMETVNELKEHANRHLSSTANTSRAQQGREKYAELVELFQAMKNEDHHDSVERLKTVRNLISAKLDETPDESDLLKNRGGFFGAYKTMSQLLDKFGKDHYRYNDRTAISTTDHLLITLYDKVTARLQHELKKAGQEDQAHSRVEILST